MNTEFQSTLSTSAMVIHLTKLLEWVAATPTRSVVSLVLFSLVCFLPGQVGIPAVDRDEARYVQATTQMLETGDYIDIRLHNQPRHNKPAGAYWLQALAVKVTASSVPAPIWVHRLPSLLGACLIVLLVYWAAQPLGDRRIAVVAGLLMATLILLNIEARLAKTDAVLNAAILCCQAVLLRLYLQCNSSTKQPAPARWALAFWFALGIGIVVKGPIILLIVTLTMVAASLLAHRTNWLRGLRPAWGLPLTLAIAMPWYIAIWFATDGAFYSEAIGDNISQRLTTAMQSHGGPPGYYLLAFWLTAWPMTVVFACALPSLFRQKSEPWVRFLTAWLVPSWLFYELIATKLLHYILPVYPALALAAAVPLVTGNIDANQRWVRVLFSVAASGPVIVVGITLGALFYLEREIPLWIVPLAVIIIAGVVASLRLIRSRELLAGWLLILLISPIAYLGAFGGIVPRMDALWLSPRLAQAAIEVAGISNPEVISVGNDEASLVFAVGTKIVFGNGIEAADFLAEDNRRVAIVESKNEPEFLARLEDHQLKPRRTTRVRGINIANGRSLDFGVHALAQ